MTSVQPVGRLVGAVVRAADPVAMNRVAVLTTTAALLALPAGAQAASGVVLSVDTHAHSLQVVDRAHHLHTLHFRGRVPHLRPGARVSYTGTSVASHLKLAGHARASVSYVARVVHAGRGGLVLALPNGHRIHFNSSQVHRVTRHGKAKRRVRAAAADAGVSINILGLQPGETVVVTESVDPSGSVTLTITLPAPSAAAGSGSGSSGGNDDGGGNDAGGESSPQDVTGTITAVSADALTITTDSGSQSFVVADPSLTDGFSVGDQVDVTYQDLGDPNPDAIDVEWVQQDATGTVTSVDDGHLTLDPGNGGAPVSFSEDPSNGDFSSVQAGDTVDVTYHLQGGQVVVDDVQDASAN